MRALLILLLLAAVSLADEYPSRTVKLVVPAAAGNGLDILTRKLLPRFEQELGGPVIIENRPGTGQLVGTLQVAKAQPDGHTLLMGTSSLVISYVTLPNVPYSIYDLTPVRGVAVSPFFLATQNKYSTFDDFLTQAKQREFLYGVLAYGTMSHLAAVRFAQDYGLKARPVSYRGTNEAMLDLVAGRIDFFFVPWSVMPANDKLRPFPKVAYNNWYGLFAPVSTPSDVRQRIERAALAAVKSPEFKAWLKQSGSEPWPLSPEKFQPFIEMELELYRRLVAETGLGK